jgi:hypothetical protein
MMGAAGIFENLAEHFFTLLYLISRNVDAVLE